MTASKYSKIKKILKRRNVHDYDILSNPRYKQLLFFSKKDLNRIRTFIKSSSVVDLLEFYEKQLTIQEKKFPADKNIEQEDLLIVSDSKI